MKVQHLQLKRDLLDTTFRVVTEDGVYALRIAGEHFQTESTFRSELEWLEHVGRHLTVPGVKRALDGDVIGWARSDPYPPRPAALLTWLPGRKLSRISETSAKELGRLAADLHRSAQDFKPSEQFDRKIWNENMMLGFFPTGGSIVSRPIDEQLDSIHLEIIEGLRNKLDRVLEKSRQDSRAFGLILADLGLHNVVWSKGKPRVFDFNDTGWGLYAYDIARTLGGLRNQRLEESLLEGYESVIPLPPDFVHSPDLFRGANLVRGMRWEAGRRPQGLPDSIKPHLKELEGLQV